VEEIRRTFFAFFDEHFSLPHHLRMKKIFLLTVFSLLIACNGKGGSSTSSTMPANSENGDGDTVVITPEAKTVTEQFVNLVNDHRKSIGLRALIHADSMAQIALGHSEDMATKKVAFGHTGFSSRCSEARDAMGGGNLCAENVATGQKTAQAVFTSWMNSSSHRANIESARHTHFGLGVAKSSSGTYYWTNLFLEL
jgi:uncharacterized protein YkwD